MATEVLGITELVDSQAAKYATHNEALRQIEGRTVRVKSRTTSAQPGSPAAGDTYIIPTGATGTDWSTQAGKIGHYYGGSWKFYAPVEGIRVWVNDEDVRVVYDGSNFVLDTKMPMLTKSVAGSSNVTLTEAESRYPAIDCTGALTGNISLIVTNTPKLLIVKNSTSGAYTLTAKTSAGSGVLVSQGTRSLVYCDGTNVVAISGAGVPTGDRKESVRVATTANITLSGTQTIDSVALSVGDRVLVKDQTTASQNGIYIVQSSTWTRAPDADTSDKVTAGMFTVVTEGGVAPDTLWVLTTNDPITLDTTALTFAQLSGGGGGTFLALTDTPSAYTSQSLKFVRVNAGETALEFATPAGSGNVSGPGSGTSTDNALVRWDGTTGTAIQDSSGYTLDDSGNLNAADKLLQRPEIKDYAETRTAPTISSGTLTLDCEQGNVFEVSLNANVTTLTLSNPPASGKAGSLTLILQQDATGGRTFAWPAAVKGPGGVKPTISSAANAIDIYTLMTTDAGTTWYVFTGGKAFA